ncbi:MAG TPA: aspartate aminotransferase family protein [Chthoniobacterales bacterium]|nr:aspartate aminotransferase family protein [Chthoniobacterales bacterium]
MFTETLSEPHLRTKTLFDEEQEFIAPGLQTIALLSELAIARGEGCNLIDLDGRTYLDLNAGVSVASLGHAHPRYIAALTAQLEAVTVGSFTSAPRAELVRLMAELAPGDLRRTQFFSGGAEAVEAAIRLARSFTKRTDIIGFSGGFHGKTAGVLTLSDVDWKQAVGPLSPNQHVSLFPDPTRFEGSADECAAASLQALRQLIEEKCAGTPAAIIMEPIQGTAGNIVPPRGFFAAVHEIAREYGALLIADEMITGFGRTGRMFGSNHDGVVPDIMTVGKGMAGGFPVSAVISTDEIMAAKPFSLPSASSSSYGGNPLAAAAVLVTLQTILDDKLTQQGAKVGQTLRDGLNKIAQKHGTIANVRGRGLLVGFDLVEQGTTRALWSKPACVQFFKACLTEGLIMMCYTPRVRVHPPLILREDEAERALSIIDRVLGRLPAC